MSDDLRTKIEARIMSGEPFTFHDLHAGLPGASYRMSDRTIQKWRKAGLISLTRVGRQTLWSLTPTGREKAGLSS